MRVLFTAGVCLSVGLSSSAARAVEDDLPVASEPPRIVPVVVADSYYAYHDSAPANRTATLFTTASRHNEAAVNLLAIGARVEHAKITGAVVLHAGSSVDALYTSPSNPLSGSREVWKHIQLANVGWKSGDFHFEAGVLPSTVGREDFVSTNNWSYTRAIIADSTPYYLTGVRVTWRFLPTMTAALTGFNGWDTHGDRNPYKSGMLRLSWAPSDRLSISNNFAAGIEQATVEGERAPIRLFDDLVVAYELHKRVSLALEAWMSHERRYQREDPRKGTVANKHILENPTTFGAALWAKWQFADSTYVALRGEAVDDPAGVITGRGGRFEEEPLIGQRLMAGTVTVGYRPHPNVLARVEGSHRLSNQRYFTGGEKLPYEETLAATGQPFSFSSDARKSSTTFVASVALSY